MNDESFVRIFKPVIRGIMERFRPGAVVLQCGADSLTGDRLGCFNLSLKGHAACVAFVRSFNIPTMVLGGGGYTHAKRGSMLDLRNSCPCEST